MAAKYIMEQTLYLDAPLPGTFAERHNKERILLSNLAFAPMLRVMVHLPSRPLVEAPSRKG